MENLLLATLRPEAAPVRNGASPRDRSAAERDRGPSAFDRQLDETVRERRDARADRQPRAVDRSEGPSEREPVERPEAPAARDDAPASDSPASGEPGVPETAADTDGTADRGATEVSTSTAETSGTAAASGDDASAGIAAAIDALAGADAIEEAAPHEPASVADEVAEPDDALAADPNVGPAAIAVTATETARTGVRTPAATDAAATTGSAAGRSKTESGDRPPEIATSPDDGPGADDAADGRTPDARPGRSADHASERALAARAAFSAAGVDPNPQGRSTRPAFVDTLAATAILDGASGEARVQGDTQTMILRIAQVGQSGRLPAIPVNTLAFQVARNFDKGINRFEIRLDPPELGRIDVRMDVDGDSRVRVHLVVERAEALDFLQRDARALERALADAGLDTDADSLSFSLDAGNQGAGGEDEATSGDGADPSLPRLAAADDESVPPPTHYVSRSGVDIRV